MINRLRDLGVNISIDDYGTGQSTLDYLKKIPANEIKIDQSFVKGIVDNRSDRLMVQSTIGLAHSLGRKVVAEGVENRDILEVLVEFDCDIAQGFAVGRPMSLESLAKRVTAGRKRRPPKSVGGHFARPKLPTRIRPIRAVKSRATFYG